MNKHIKRFLFISLIGVSPYLKTSYGLPKPIKKRVVLEVVTFTVKKQLKPNAVQRLAMEVTPLLKKYPGFISREFAQSTSVTNQYIDIVKWRSLNDATYAAKNSLTDKKMKHFLSVIKDYKMRHYYESSS